MQPRIETAQQYLDDPGGAKKVLAVLRERRNVEHARLRTRSWLVLRRTATEEDLRRHFNRLSADANYFLSTPLGWREGAVTVWAGMRGAITLAAAQTLPFATPHRSRLIFIAFLVATASLLIQGSTIGAAVRWLQPQTDDPDEVAKDRAELRTLINRAGAEARGRRTRHRRDRGATPGAAAGPVRRSLQLPRTDRNSGGLGRYPDPDESDARDPGVLTVHIPSLTFPHNGTALTW